MYIYTTHKRKLKIEFIMIVVRTSYNASQPFSSAATDNFIVIYKSKEVQLYVKN